MGNHKFSISDVVPSSWLYKLKNIAARPKAVAAGRKTQPKTAAAAAEKQRQRHPPQPSVARKSYHVTRPDTRNKSNTPDTVQSYRRSPRGRSLRLAPSPVSSSEWSCGCHQWRSSASLPRQECYPSPPDTSPDFLSDDGDCDGETLPEFLSDGTCSSTCSCGAADVVIDANANSSSFERRGFGSVPELELAPVFTKSLRRPKNRDADQKASPRGSGRRFSGHHPRSPGVRLRVNSPRIAARRVHGRRSAPVSGSASASSSTTASTTGGGCCCGSEGEVSGRRRSVSDSVAVVKASKDPKSDFRQSMVEMISQNKLWETKELEELLACYLSLNSDEYHGLIITVFKQIWLDLSAPSITP